MKIGEIMPLDRDIILNEGKETVALLVANTGAVSYTHLDVYKRQR